MVNGRFTSAVAVVSLMASIAKPAGAQPSDPGCGLLGEMVRRVLISELSAWRGEFVPPQATALVESSEPQLCGRTSLAVSSAFTAVMARFGMRVRWGYPPAGGLIGCFHHDIGNCDPFPDPMGPRLTSADRAFVTASWNRVRRRVVARMPSGTASDVSDVRASASTGNVQSGVALRPPRTGH